MRAVDLLLLLLLSMSPLVPLVSCCCYAASMLQESASRVTDWLPFDSRLVRPLHDSRTSSHRIE